MVSKALKQSFMDVHLSSTSPLPWIWVIETLARSNQIDPSLLLDLVEKTREICDDLGKNARELVSLRILENVFVPGASGNSVTSTANQKIGFDPSEPCEDVIRYILTETSASNLKASGPDMLKWNIEPFVVEKRARMTKNALQQLKDAILTGSHPLPSSVKEQSGLSVEHQPAHRVPINEGNGVIRPTVEGKDTDSQIIEADININSTALTNGNALLHKNPHDENLLSAKRGRSSSTKNAGGKKYKHDIISNEQGIGGNLRTSGLDRHLEEPAGKGQNGHSADGNRESISSKCLVDHEELLPLEKQVSHHDIVVPNDKPNEEKEQECGIIEAEGDKDGTREVNVNILSVAEDVDISSDSDGYDDESTDIATKKDAFLISQSTYTQNSSPMTDWKELDLCVKCNGNGKLLVCASSSCPIVIHEGCLGSPTSFETREKFYCPFCAYSRAISKYLDVKKRTALARKDLATFISFGTSTRSKKQSRGSHRSKKKQGQKDDRVQKKNEHVNDISLEDEDEETIDSNNGTHCNLEINDQEEKSSGKNCQSRMVHEQHETAEPDIRKSQGNKRSVKGVSCPPERDLSCEHTCAQSTDVDEISDTENETSKYFIRYRKQESSSRPVPLFRRMRLSWTNAEEEALKEGVRRFTSPHDKSIPWKIILEFGTGIFQKGRTTIHLKDKWRNISKASQ